MHALIACTHKIQKQKQVMDSYIPVPVNKNTLRMSKHSLKQYAKDQFCGHNTLDVFETGFRAVIIKVFWCKWQLDDMLSQCL